MGHKTCSVAHEGFESTVSTAAKGKDTANTAETAITTAECMLRIRSLTY